MKFPPLHPLLLFAVLVPGGAVGSDDGGMRAALQVREIFEAKCLDCHGPELPRPKGKFGYVLDLKRLADNPEYVTRGKPDDSEIYLMVLNDEMPGEDAKVPPLTAEEKEIVRRWIALGAPDAPPVPGDRPAQVVAEPGHKRQMPVWKRITRWIGRVHAVSTHFPIALVMVATFTEGLAWWTGRNSWLQTIRLLVILGTFGALTAAGLGWINASFASYNGQLVPVLNWHRWLGTGTALWCLVCALLVVASDCHEGSLERQRFRGALLLGAALVGISGFLGSALIYGLDHYAWN